MAIKFPKLRVAVAGTSFGGLVQIPVFQSHPRTQVIAVSSGRAERAAKTSKDLGIPAHYTNFEEMLDKEKPDLVSIVTPPNLHCPMSLAALSRGIHVLCEKPFAMDVEEAKQMNAAAENANVVAMVDYEFRFLPARTYAAELLRQNYIGELRMADLVLHAGMRSKAEDVLSRIGLPANSTAASGRTARWVRLKSPRYIDCHVKTRLSGPHFGRY